MYIIVFPVVVIMVIVCIIIECCKKASARRDFDRKAQAMREERAQRAAAIAEQRNQNLAFFHEHIFNPVPSNASIQTAWARWEPSLHDSDQALDTQTRAIYETGSLFLDRDALTGTIIDCSGIMKAFSTTLHSCTCASFKTRSQPCQHIYRLFHDLNDPQEKALEIPKGAECSFFTLNEKTQDDFISYIQHMPAHGRDVYLHEDIQAEIDAGLFIRSDDINFTPFLEKMTKDQLILALAKSGIQGYRPSWTKVKLIDWVCETQPDFLKRQFKQYAHICPSEEAIAIGKRVRTIRHDYHATSPTSWTSAVNQRKKDLEQ